MGNFSVNCTQSSAIHINPFNSISAFVDHAQATGGDMVQAADELGLQGWSRTYQVVVGTAAAAVLSDDAGGGAAMVGGTRPLNPRGGRTVRFV